MRIDENCGNPISGGNIKDCTLHQREQELLAEIAELRKDAERLDYLCNGDFIYWIHIQTEPHGDELFHSSQVHELRKAIDAAMQQTDKEVKG